MYHNLQMMVQVNGNHSGLLQPSSWSGRVAASLQSSMSLLCSPYSIGLGMRGQICRIPFVGPLTAKVSAYADVIAVFVSHRLDIKAVKKAVARYEQIAGAKISFDKSEGLWLGAWRVAFPCQVLSAGGMDTSASSGCGLCLASYRIEIGQRHRLR